MGRRARLWRQMERTLLGAVMAVAARIVERRLLRMVERRATPAA
ncbi:MAG: hypothetical protein ACRDI0_12310 [Actinomycetota bacterium]